MARRILRTRTQFTSTLENARYQGLKDLSDSTDIPISKLLDKAVDALLREKDIVIFANKKK